MILSIRKYSIILLVLSTVMVSGQEVQQGSLEVITDPRIDQLVNLHIDYNKLYPTMPGFRIQIYMESGNEALSKAEELKEEFEEKYREINAYLIFNAPYYRIRVGDFRTRLEAENFLTQINRKYPNAWVIQDDINFPELSNYQKLYEDE